MALTTQPGGHEIGFKATTRQDNWWVGPAATFCGFMGFIIYTTWAAFQGEHYWHGSYLSPLYSPVLFLKEGVAGAAPMAHTWVGTWPEWWPAFLPASPALLILIFPGSFRFTCYYYRKAYYRSFTGSPPGCAVGALPQKQYKGETALLLFQNLHRYALYFALAFIVILYYDAFISFFRGGEIAMSNLGVGVGSFVLLINATLLAGYTFGCHSFRHLIGGKLNRFSGGGCASMRHSAWRGCSKLNAKHQLFAWLSLFWVGFTDVYVRLCSMGIITDLNTWS